MFTYYLNTEFSDQISDTLITKLSELSLQFKKFECSTFSDEKYVFKFKTDCNCSDFFRTIESQLEIPDDFNSNEFFTLFLMPVKQNTTLLEFNDPTEKLDESDWKDYEKNGQYSYRICIESRKDFGSYLLNNNWEKADFVFNAYNKVPEEEDESSDEDEVSDEAEGPVEILNDAGEAKVGEEEETKIMDTVDEASTESDESDDTLDSGNDVSDHSDSESFYTNDTLGYVKFKYSSENTYQLISNIEPDVLLNQLTRAYLNYVPGYLIIETFQISVNCKYKFHRINLDDQDNQDDLELKFNKFVKYVDKYMTEKDNKITNEETIN